MANHSQVKLISECFVKPHLVEQAKQPYNLAPDDLFSLSLNYIQRGLLFVKPPTFNIGDLNSLLEKLKHALSLALIHFYPLAGQLATKKYEDERSSWIYVDCQKGPGARFIHAQGELTVSDIVLYTPDVLQGVGSLFDLGERGVINHDGHTKPLLTVQVTELVDGVFIGFAMNHSLVDGTSMWHFINTLSEIYKSNIDGEDMIPTISSPPIYRSAPVIKLPFLSPDEFTTRVDMDVNQIRERYFSFSAASMAMLKAKTNAESGTELPIISSFQSLCALVWKSITRARGTPPDQETIFSIVLNIRARSDPPLSPDYFGNFISMAQGKCKVEELLGNGLGSAALRLNQAIAAQDANTRTAFYNYYIEHPFVAQPGGSSSSSDSYDILIAGSARFDVYAPEFGLGRAVAVRSGYGNKGKGKVSAYPGSEGAGSVDLEICLPPQTMTKLELDEEFMSYVSSN